MNLIYEVGTASATTKWQEIEPVFITRSRMKRRRSAAWYTSASNAAQRSNPYSVIGLVSSWLLRGARKGQWRAIAPGGNQQMLGPLAMPAWKAETTDGEASATARSRGECAASLRPQYRPQPARTAPSLFRLPLSPPIPGHQGY